MVVTINILSATSLKCFIIFLSTARINANHFYIVQLWAVLNECLQIEIVISIDIDGVNFFVFQDGVAYI